MRIALISDIHDRVDHLAAALGALTDPDGTAGRCDALLCLGDLCSPFVLAQLAEGFAGPVHLVFGNNDADTFRMTRLASGHDHLTLHGEFAVVELAGRRIGLTHFPAVAEACDPRAFDLIAYGHDHTFAIGRAGVERSEGDAWRVNPGPLMGWSPSVGEVPASFAVWDTDRDTVDGFRLGAGGDAEPHGDEVP